METQATVKRDTPLAIGALLGTDLFAEFLACIPDEFYYLPEEAREPTFQKMLHAATRGERNPAALAKMAEETNG